MKTKHNKKRNTAFVYEALVREATVAILKNDIERRNKAITIIKKHFKSGSPLQRDLECHRSLYENQGLDSDISEKILREAKLANRLIDPRGVFQAQTALIDDINKELEPSVFGNFVPNYKHLASIAQIFSVKTSPKQQVMLEREVVKGMTERFAETAASETVDVLVVAKFVEKFNEKYEGELLPEQKELLTYYIGSFADNALELKSFLNEEISRLKDALQKATTIEEIREDSTMRDKTQQIIGRLEEYAKRPIDDEMLFTIMKTQSLAKEIYTDGDNS